MTVVKNFTDSMESNSSKIINLPVTKGIVATLLIVCLSLFVSYTTHANTVDKINLPPRSIGKPVTQLAMAYPAHKNINSFTVMAKENISSEIMSEEIEKEEIC